MEEHDLGLSRTSRYVPPGFAAQQIIRSIFEQNIDKGCLTLRFKDGDISIGEGDPTCTIEPPSLPRFIRLLVRPDLNVADHYVRGFWNCERAHLYDLLELLFENHDSLLWRYFNYLNDRNSLRDSLIYRLFPNLINRKTAIHYSSNIDFMKVVLGETLLYTCAFFEDEADSLECAQLNKVLKVAQRLELDTSDNVLELGCGWGNAAQIISKKYLCRVTGVNLTKHQIDYAREYASDLTKFIHSSVSSYTPEKLFSKIYSIGMLEHIGSR